MSITPLAALVFLIPVLPICIWVAWSDMKFMRIPNKAVIATCLVFMVTGLFVLPFLEYLFRYLHFIVVLLAAILISETPLKLVGAGDAKYLAAMAPFVDLDDATLVVPIFAGVLLAAFTTHRIFRAAPMIRIHFPDWASWTHPKFPMGLALSGTLLIYLGLGAFYFGDPFSS